MCKPEPLINKKEVRTSVTRWTSIGSGYSVPTSWGFKADDVKSAVEFYKRYTKYSGCSAEYSFKREQPEGYKLWIKFRDKKYKEMKYTYLDSIAIYHWKDWLFNYSFKDVI